MEEDYVVGTCQTMCPRKEAELRQRENLLHKYEMKKGTESEARPQYDPNRIVKRFVRSAAGVETTTPANLRPFPVLLKTIEYLYIEIFPRHVEKPLVVYDFMFDRFRAVRQDAVIQNLSPEETIRILEPIVRFLIYFGYVLLGTSGFDAHINSTHLQECMKRLLVCYGQPDDGRWTNRWEIESAYLLFNLGDIKPLTRGMNLCLLESDSDYLFSLKLSFQWYLKNYSKVFGMIPSLSPLLLCVVSHSLPDVRKYSLQALCHAYSSANSSYPVSRLRSLMLYENDSQVHDECKCFNVQVSEGRVNFLKKEFDSSAKGKQGVRLKWIDEKLSECDLVMLLFLGESKNVLCDEDQYRIRNEGNDRRNDRN